MTQWIMRVPYMMCRLNKEFFDHLRVELGQLRFAVNRTTVLLDERLFVRAKNNQRAVWVGLLFVCRRWRTGWLSWKQCRRSCKRAQVLFLFGIPELNLHMASNCSVSKLILASCILLPQKHMIRCKLISYQPKKGLWKYCSLKTGNQL